MANHGKREWLRKNMGTFLRQYQRKAHRGYDPNDRNYDRKVEQEVKRLPPEELSRLMSGEGAEEEP